MRIFVIDDEKIVLEVIETFLTKRGHQVCTAENAYEAMSALGNIDGQIDVILCDVCLPSSDGISILKATKEKYPEIHILLMTGNRDAIQPTTALEEGACAFLRKPLKLKELDSILNQISEFRQNRGMIQSLNEKIEQGQHQYSELTKDIHFLQKLQTRMLPNNLNWLKRTQINLRYIPMSSVGGDFVDIRPYGNNQVLLWLSDISGHGIPAAFINIALKTALSSICYHLSPATIITEVERILAEILPRDFYITAFCGVYHETERTLLYSLAGHAPPFLLSSTRKSVLLEGSDPAIGIESCNKRSYYRTELRENDILFVFTDGLTKHDNNLFEAIQKRMIEQENTISFSRNLQRFSTSVLDIANELEPTNAFTDDLTVMSLTPSAPLSLDELPAIEDKSVALITDNRAISQAVRNELTDHVAALDLYGSVRDITENSTVRYAIILLELSDQVYYRKQIARLRHHFPMTPIVVLSDNLLDGERVKYCIKENVAAYLTLSQDNGSLTTTIQKALLYRAEEDTIQFDDVRSDWMDFVISSSPTVLDLLNQYLKAIKSHPIPDKIQEDVLYCIREITGNAIEWGNLNNPEFKIRISTVFLPDRIMIKITDEGGGFEVKDEMVADKDLFESQEERERAGKRQGGFGLAIVKDKMDSVRFNDKGNVVVLEKYIDQLNPGMDGENNEYRDLRN